MRVIPSPCAERILCTVVSPMVLEEGTRGEQREEREREGGKEKGRVGKLVGPCTRAGGSIELRVEGGWIERVV